MAIEKEYDGHLYDQLAILERLEEVAKETGDQKVLEAIAKEKGWIERKLVRPTAVD